MTYVINREQAKDTTAAYQKTHKKYTAINTAGLFAALLGMAALMVLLFTELSVWCVITCLTIAVVGGLTTKLTDRAASRECLAARFFELEEKYKILEFKKTTMSAIGVYGGNLRITAMTEDEDGNVTERYVGMAKAQYNTRYQDTTLDINQQVVYFPYPPKEGI